MPRHKDETEICVRLVLRLPETVHALCKAHAIKERRSLNDHLVVMLEKRLSEEKKETAEDVMVIA